MARVPEENPADLPELSRVIQEYANTFAQNYSEANLSHENSELSEALETTRDAVIESLGNIYSYIESFLAHSTQIPDANMGPLAASISAELTSADRELRMALEGLAKRGEG